MGGLCSRRGRPGQGQVQDRLPLFDHAAAETGTMPVPPSELQGPMTSEAGLNKLLVAGRDNDAAAVRALLAQGCSPDVGNRMGQTPLHIAAMWGSAAALAELLAGGGDPDVRNRMRGQTPLHFAAAGRGTVEGRAACAKLLVTARADPAMADSSGERPLDIAGDDEVRLALGLVPLYLHEAVISQSAEAVEEVLRDDVGGVQLEATAPGSGVTPLHLAAGAGWLPGLERLLAARADATARDSFNRTPLHLAVQTGLGAGGPAAAVIVALCRGGADLEAQDLDADADPNFTSTKQKSDEHRTALHYAAAFASPLATRPLLAAGANPNACGSSMETPLHLCCLERLSEPEAGCGVIIAGAGLAVARPELEGVCGTVVNVEEKRPGCLPVLVEGAANPVWLEASGLRRATDEVLDALLEAKADPNLTCQLLGDSFTLLHEAARLDDRGLAGKLLAARATVDLSAGPLGMTALHLAARSRNAGVSELLLAARANPELHTATGKTAAELARTNGASAAMVAMLSGDGSAAAAAAAEAEVPAVIPTPPATPQRLQDMSAEQRAMLFID